jgi:large subunit ribosomal protein L3
MTTATQQAAARAPVTALLGRKLGMTQVWDDAGRLVPVTVVQVGTNVVTQVRTPEEDGYSAVQLAFGQVDPRRVSQPLRGHFAKAGVTPRRHVAEVRTPDAASFSLGQEIDAQSFEAGARVDVVGTTKGKGTAGVMKRHGFSGVGASHGAHRNHRKPGSIGGAATPSRVFKGLRMAGRLGGAQQTTQNLRVHAVDADKGLLLVTGAVPGPKGGIVLVRSAVKGA